LAALVIVVTTTIGLLGCGAVGVSTRLDRNCGVGLRLYHGLVGDCGGVIFRGLGLCWWGHRLILVLAAGGLAYSRVVDGIIVVVGHLVGIS